MEDLKHGTGIKNKKSGSIACICESFKHNGENTNWLIVTCYHILFTGKNRYQYINHDDIIKKWNILTPQEFDQEFKKIHNLE